LNVITTTRPLPTVSSVYRALIARVGAGVGGAAGAPVADETAVDETAAAPLAFELPAEPAGLEVPPQETMTAARARAGTRRRSTDADRTGAAHDGEDAFTATSVKGRAGAWFRGARAATKAASRPEASSGTVTLSRGMTSFWMESVAAQGARPHHPRQSRVLPLRAAHEGVDDVRGRVYRLLRRAAGAAARVVESAERSAGRSPGEAGPRARDPGQRGQAATPPSSQAPTRLASPARRSPSCGKPSSLIETCRAHSCWTRATRGAHSVERRHSMRAACCPPHSLRRPLL
jgi:hypothetical protein